MNRRLFVYCIKSLRRRTKSILRTALAVFLSFVFVCGILLFQENIYRWQVESSKKRFGDWFVMYEAGSEKEELANHPYLDKAVLVQTVNTVFDYNGSTGIRIGKMSDEFIRKENITLSKGHFPENDEEVAIDWNSLLSLNQSYEIGDEITISSCSELNLKEDNRIEKTYRLAGILESYTNVWQGGEKLPGVVLHESDNTFSVNSKSAANVYLYPLKSFIKENDYSKIYENINKDARLAVYNSSVYDYEPWGSEIVYNYMYILVMIIGVTAISYQMLSYNRSRKSAQAILKGIGASDKQLKSIYVMENTFILVLSSLLGFVFASVLGKVICLFIENKTGISFYGIGMTVVLKTFITFAVSCLISAVVSMAGFDKLKKNSVVNKNSVSTRIKITAGNVLNKKNYKRETSRRFIKNSGFLPNSFIRIFNVIMTVVIVMCAVNITGAYKEYDRNKDRVDFVGYQKDDEGVEYNVYYLVDNNKFKEYIKNSSTFDYEMYKNVKADDVSLENFRENSSGGYSSFNMRLSSNLKKGDTILYKGIDDNTLNTIKNTQGVSSLNYGYFETGRVLNWTDMDYEELGVYKYLSGNNENIGKGKYLFASEYVEPSMQMYELIAKYAKESLDYEEFKNGDAVVVFEDVNAEGKYDSSMKDGVSLNLMQYYDSSIRGKYNMSNNSSYADKIENYIIKDMLNKNIITDKEAYSYLHNADDSYKISDRLNTYITSDMSYEDLIQKYGDVDSYWNSETEKMKFFYGSKENLEKKYERILRNKCAAEKKIEFNYNYYYTPVATTKVAAVVKVTDEIKEELEEYIPEFGQYTVFASTQLAQRALDSQNNEVKKFLGVDELPNEIKLELKCNQLSIVYGLDSAYSSTGNIVASYLGKAGFIYKTYSEEKDELKKKTIESMMMYGFSLLAAVLVELAVGFIITRSRMEEYKSRILLLKRMGAGKRDIFGIFIRQNIREAVWSVFIAPFKLLLESLVILKTINSL
ncbi:MAG: ABC transporter permease [Lachnospira sp.]|nr:ABC transporter permease [Lachnospira sp.]